MAIGHDCVVAALHVFDSGGGAMPNHWIRAGATGMIMVETKTMCSAVVHIESIICDDGPCTGGGSWSGGHGHQLGHSKRTGCGRGFDKCCIGTVETGLTGGELA